MRILVVEDNLKLADNIAKILYHQYYMIDIATTGKSALQQANVNDYQLIILDLGLPDIDGIEVCKQLRTQLNNVAILMLTARADLDSKVAGLDTGADDYLTKPFVLDELLARIRALLRRNQNCIDNTFHVGDLLIDLGKRVVNVAGKSIDLSPTELRILEFLLLNRGTAKNSSEIYSAVWGSNDTDAMFSDTLKVHMARLRKKLNTDIIKTVPGWGYIIDAGEDDHPTYQQ